MISVSRNVWGAVINGSHNNEEWVGIDECICFPTGVKTILVERTPPAFGLSSLSSLLSLLINGDPLVKVLVMKVKSINRLMNKPE